MQGRKRFLEKTRLHFKLSERVPLHNFYRRLNVRLDGDCLYPLTAPYISECSSGKCGQKSITAFLALQLAVWYFIVGKGLGLKGPGKRMLKYQRFHLLNFVFDKLSFFLACAKGRNPYERCDHSRSLCSYWTCSTILSLFKWIIGFVSGFK